MIGIITAIDAEFKGILERAELESFERVAGMNFCTLKIWGEHVILVKGGVGKVNAAVAAQILIDKFKVNKLINVGVGGSLVDTLKPGEIVISTDAIQHDVDARAFGHKRGEIPNTGKISFPASKNLLLAAELAAKRLGCHYVLGRILTADKAVGDTKTKKEIVSEFSGILCEMEGAAILHVAELNDIEAVIIRSVSDNADEETSDTYHKNLVNSVDTAAKLVTEMILIISGEKKGFIRPTRAEINLDNLIYNYRNIKRRAEGKKICAVVKADAYGHGFEAIKAIEAEDPDYYAVACIEEAIALRDRGITRPILILGYTFPERAEELVKYHITPTVYDYETAKAFSDYAIESGEKLPVHVKIETGMGRIGIDYREALERIVELSALEGIKLEGIFTHFATADSLDKDFTRLQKKRFDKVIEKLEKNGIEIPVKHVENSAAIMDLDFKDYDMVRPGIVLYGHYPSEEVKVENLDIKPVMRFLSRVIQVKEIEPGESIGYGRSFIAERPMTVATFPAGYADGFSRILSHKNSEVYIGGKRAPILGNICMDQAVADVTGIEVKVGDDVEIFGENLSAEEYAKWMGTIPYEVTCMVNKRVPRVYIRDGKINSVVNEILE